jgi:hypothetical protein
VSPKAKMEVWDAAVGPQLHMGARCGGRAGVLEVREMEAEGVVRTAERVPTHQRRQGRDAR